jgi:hypothetical protein
MPRKGKVSLVDNHMADIIKHDYLRNSIEQRVERQALYNEYLDSYKQNSKMHSKRHTKASQLRSMSNLEKFSASSSYDLKGEQSQNSRSSFNYESEKDYQAMKNKLSILRQAN